MTYEFQSDCAREYFGEGKAAGKIEIILKMLSKKYGALSEPIETRVRDVDSEELDGVAERLLNARTAEDAVGIETVAA